jgi:O-Antigen ligase
VVLLLPGLLTGYASFRSGGFLAGTPALLAVAVGILLVLRVTLAEEPFAGFNRAITIPAAALGLFAAWTLVSSVWSDTPGRAMIEFDRALLYWLVFLLCGSLVTDHRRLAWALRGVALALLVVATGALASRLLPNLVEVDPALAAERLNWPLTYWNTLGLLTALGLTFFVHLTCSEREPAPLRVIGAAALPILATTLYLTFSRGSILVAAFAVVAYLVLARPRALLPGLIAVGPAAAVAVIAATRADLLGGAEPTTAAAAAQGEDLALVVGLCVLGAGLVRTLLLPADRRLTALVISRRVRRSAWAAAAALLASAALVAVVAFDAGDRVTEGVERFSSDGNPRGEFRDRLLDPTNNGRLEQWEIALRAFRDEPVIGLGAGKFGQHWLEKRDSTLKVEDAHSLYIETLAELGLVGLLLLLVAVGGILVGIGCRLRGESGHLNAALLAAGLAWAVHAGIDWDWEMPATTVWLFGLGALALSRRRSAKATVLSPGRPTRVAIGVACLALLVPAALMVQSQRKLNESVTALKRNDCSAAVDAALTSSRAMSVRPEPFEVLGYCDVRLGHARLGVQMLEAAVRRDPDSWERHYGLALVRAAAGLDPRAEARRALELNPLDSLARTAVRRFQTSDPVKWKRYARSARLPIL